MGESSGVCGCGTSAGMARAAEAMLRALGGGEAVLRFRGVPLSDGASSNPRLGLATNLGDDVVLAPATVRDAGGGDLEFVMAARPVQEQIDQRQTGTADALFASALGFVRGEKLLRITNVSAELFLGTPYLYRLTARE